MDQNPERVSGINTTQNLQENSNTDKVASNFQKRLRDILDTPLTPNNINTYFDSALEHLVWLTEEIVSDYARTHPDLRTSPAEFEDIAFEANGIRLVPEILSLISENQQLMERISRIADNTFTIIDSVILPPGEQPRIVRTGSGEFEEPGQVDRFKTLLFILNKNGVAPENLDITEGEITYSMVRQTSYASVSIPEMNRLVLVCDEEGNSTFIFNLEEMRSLGITQKEIMQMTKAQIKDELIAQYPRVATCLDYSTRWVERINELLLGDFLPIGNNSVNEDLPQISTSELDPWQGFYEENGSYFAPLSTIASKLGISNVIERVRNEEARGKLFSNRQIRSHQNMLRTGYEYTEISSLFPNIEQALKADAEGEWAGFALFKGKHYSFRAQISAKLGMDSHALFFTAHGVRDDLVQLEALPLNVGGRFFPEAYALEDIVAMLDKRSQVDRVNTAGEWENFISASQELHFGTRKAISEKLNMEKSLLADKISSAEKGGVVFRSKTIIALGGRKRKGYCFEDVAEYFRKVSEKQEPGWDGFYLEEDYHFSSTQKIARRLGIAWETVDKKIRIAESEGSALAKRVKEGGRNGIFTSYAFEQVELLFADLLSLPTPLTDGEWTGFIEYEVKKHFGLQAAIAKKLNIHLATLRYWIAAAEAGGKIFSRRPCRSFHSQVYQSYCLEELQELVNLHNLSK
jgi:transposase